MAVYVDKPRKHDTPLRYKVWSHMWSDKSDDELHAMAREIGLKLEWFQQSALDPADPMIRLRNHYDIVPSKRELARQKGAKEMEVRTFLNLLKIGEKHI